MSNTRQLKTAWTLVPIKVQYWADDNEVGCANWTDLDECTRALECNKFETHDEAMAALKHKSQ